MLTKAMSSGSMGFPARVLGGAVLVFGVALTSLAAHAHGAGPFAGLAGSWSGGGNITLSSGASERIRCRATYAVAPAGNALQQTLRCASDSYRFDLTGNVASQGGALSGSWTEATRSASGTLSGRISGGQMQLRAEGPGFGANLAVATRGDRQSVSIRSAGTDISEVAITLSRAGE